MINAFSLDMAMSQCHKDMFRLDQLEDLDQPLLGQNLDEFSPQLQGDMFFWLLGKHHPT